VSRTASVGLHAMRRLIVEHQREASLPKNTGTGVRGAVGVVEGRGFMTTISNLNTTLRLRSTQRGTLR
jgi:hypothetical protein